MIRIIVAFLVIALTACQTTDPYTGEQKTTNTAKGAGIGVLAGAILGAAVSSKKDRKKGALQGAILGGATGGGVGYYMDRQETKLRQQLQGTGVQVKREGDNLRLIMPGNITFATGRYEVKSNFYPTLKSVALVLKEFTKTSISIAGHTDSTGSASLNQTLSQRRAASVGEYLLSNGVARNRVQTIGFGPRSPIASNSSATGRQANRRVELQLVPTGQ